MSPDLADTASASTDLIDVADSDCQGPHAEQYTQCTVAPDLADSVCASTDSSKGWT